MYVQTEDCLFRRQGFLPLLLKFRIYLLRVLPILLVFKAIVGFDDGRSKPGARVELHESVIEGSFSSFVLLEGCFFHVAITLLELLDGVLGCFCGEDGGHDAHMWAARSWYPRCESARAVTVQCRQRSSVLGRKGRWGGFEEKEISHADLVGDLVGPRQTLACVHCHPSDAGRSASQQKSLSTIWLLCVLMQQYPERVCIGALTRLPA